MFRTWPTVASPQAQKRLDDDAEMIEAVDPLPPERMRELRDRYAAKQSERYETIAKGREDQKKYLPGWLGRTEYFRTLKPPR